MIRVKAFVINTNGIHLLCFQIQFDVIERHKFLVAHWARGVVHQPGVDTGRMKNMKTGKHSTSRLVGNGLNTNNTFLNKVFCIFHSYQSFLELLVSLSWKELVYLVLRSFYELAKL